MDNNSIPITYELFPGNTNDCLTYRPNLARIKKEFDPGRVISGADKEMKKTVHEKQVVFWSEKYAKRAKADRAAAILKARDLAKHPGSHTRATSYGAAKYVKKLDYDKETGEILTASSILELDEEKLKAEESLDGYYVLLTSEMDQTNNKFFLISICTFY